MAPPPDAMVRTASWSRSSATSGQPGSWSRSTSTARQPASARSSATTTTGASLTLPGLRAKRMGAALAEYFGPDATDGLLVIEVDGRWNGLRVGDVIVAVNGKRLERGVAPSVCLETGRGDRVSVVRRGKLEEVTV